MGDPTIEDAAALVATVMEDIESMGFDLHEVRVLVSNRKTKRRLASSAYPPLSITLYWPIHGGDLDWFEDTIRHEAAHCLLPWDIDEGPHGPQWQEMAERIGAHPSRINSPEAVARFNEQKGKKRWDDQ